VGSVGWGRSYIGRLTVWLTLRERGEIPWDCHNVSVPPRLGLGATTHSRNAHPRILLGSSWAVTHLVAPMVQTCTSHTVANGS
jgi:hypothetical protein